MLIVIILNYNDSITTVNYIQRIHKYNNIDKIIIVDNGSTDNSYEFMKDNLLEYKNLDIISTGENFGYARGNNFGIKYASEQYCPQIICISNPDIEISDESINRMKSFLIRNEKVGIVSGLVKNCKGKLVSNYTWKLPSYSSVLFSFAIISRIRQRLYLIKIKRNEFSLNTEKVYRVDGVPGCFFMIRFEVFKEIGFFDSSTFLYGEENILAYNLREKKYSNYLLSTVDLIHFQGTSINKSINSHFKKVNLIFEGREVYLRKILKISVIKFLVYKIFVYIQKFEILLIYVLKKIIRILSSSIIFVQKCLIHFLSR